jgi:ubiquinone/menaquinone biosynthesis C-methylase UbiE
MIKISRSFNWVSAIDEKNNEKLRYLQQQMSHYYSNVNSYYNEIDFTNNVWEDVTQLPQQRILEILKSRTNILEVGCGKANILKNHSELEPYYTGIDFSTSLINENKEKYKKATFATINDAAVINFESERFDAVFSHFVLEHTVYPHLFLNECYRVLKKGGVLIVICPEILGTANVSSQRVGFSQGSGRNKLIKGRLIDAIITGYDNKMRLSQYCKRLSKMASKSPLFFVNLAPTCFTDKFQPDVDAVYLAYESEIRQYLRSSIEWDENSSEIKLYCEQHKIILLVGTRL